MKRSKMMKRVISFVLLIMITSTMAMQTNAAISYYNTYCLGGNLYVNFGSTNSSDLLAIQVSGYNYTTQNNIWYSDLFAGQHGSYSVAMSLYGGSTYNAPIGGWYRGYVKVYYYVNSVYYSNSGTIYF